MDNKIIFNIGYKDDTRTYRKFFMKQLLNEKLVMLSIYIVAFSVWYAGENLAHYRHVLSMFIAAGCIAEVLRLLSGIFSITKLHTMSDVFAYIEDDEDLSSMYLYNRNAKICALKLVAGNTYIFFDNGNISRLKSKGRPDGNEIYLTIYPDSCEYCPVPTIDINYKPIE